MQALDIKIFINWATFWRWSRSWKWQHFGLPFT